MRTRTKAIGVGATAAAVVLGLLGTSTISLAGGGAASSAPGARNVRTVQIPAAQAPPASPAIHPANPAPDAPTGTYQPERQRQAFNTLTGAGPVAKQKVAANTTLTFDMAGQAGVPSSGATAVVLLVEVKGASSAGSLGVYAAGGPAPTSPEVSFASGTTVTSQVIAPLGLGSAVVFKPTTGVNLVVSVTGYFAPSSLTHVVTETSADWLWNSQYIFSTNPSSYTEYFTRYVNISVPAITSSVLASGTVQVYFEPSLSETADSWTPLPYQFTDGTGDFDYDYAFVTSLGQVQLEFFFVQRNPTATLPTLSTFTLATSDFKVVVTPGTAG